MIATMSRAHKSSQFKSAGKHIESHPERTRPLPVARSLASLAILLIVLVLQHAEARYIQSTYRITPAVYDGQHHPQLRTESSLVVGSSGPQATRRQDYEGDEADGDDGDNDDDQRAAASYRNQDDSSGGAGDGGNSGGDSYGDNEPDGPYEETPVEQEGQADLERFFDDHLGASDREGMDKENLPSNMIATRSEAPLDLMGSKWNQFAPNGAAPVVLTAVPLPPVQNPIVRSRILSKERFDDEEQFSSAPTVQTSFIRLPDEKLIITRQVTAARNSPRGPLKLDATDQDNLGIRKHLAMAPADASLAPDGTNAIDKQVTNGSLAGAPAPVTSPFSSQLFGLRISPTETLPGLAPSGSFSPVADEGPKARSIVSTEDDDFEPVYVTSETNKPFEIDALGGFDPEADFNDAARELQVDVGDGLTRRAEIKRRGAGQQTEHDAGQIGGLLNGPVPPIEDAAGRQQQQEQNLREIIFGEPDTDKMYEDASETDEVTFDHDDPYQTDLEAEMRQQELEKLQASLRAAKQTNDQPSDRADSMNVVVDDGLNGNQAQADDDDIDSDIDNEYKPEPTRQRNSITGSTTEAAAASPGKAGDIDDEGAWVNDGADDMEVPSQSHQNSVLDRAEQQNRAAADAEMAAAPAAAAAAASEQVADEPNDKQDPDGDDGGPSESGQTNEDGVENIRMPNADYLKNDFIEDDSGYAAA